MLFCVLFLLEPRRWTSLNYPASLVAFLVCFNSFLHCILGEAFSSLFQQTKFIFRSVHSVLHLFYWFYLFFIATFYVSKNSYYSQFNLYSWNLYLVTNVLYPWIFLDVWGELPHRELHSLHAGESWLGKPQICRAGWNSGAEVQL